MDQVKPNHVPDNNEDEVEYPYEFLELPVKELVVDHTSYPYQRPLNTKRVQKMVDSFNPLLLDPLLVSVRDDNKCYLVRGQHRRAMIMQKFGEDARTRCRVYYGLTPKQEAFIYVKEDEIRKRQLPMERWEAGLLANEEPYISIKRILDEEGWTMNFNATGEQRNIKAISAVITIYNRRPKTLRPTLRAVVAAGWDNEPPEAILLSGISDFLGRYGEFLAKDFQLGEFLGRIGKLDLIDRARMHAKINHSYVTESITSILVIEYNKNRRSKNRLGV